MGAQCSCPEADVGRKDPEASLDEPVAVNDDTPPGGNLLSSPAPDDTPSDLIAEPGLPLPVEEAKATPLVESKDGGVDKVSPEHKAKDVEEKTTRPKQRTDSEDSVTGANSLDLKKKPRKEALPKVEDHPVRNAADVRCALKVLCIEHGMCCSIVYKLDKRSNTLYVDKDESYAGTAPDFFDKSLSCSGSLHIGEGIVGRVWANKGKEFDANVCDLDEKMFPRKEIAQMDNIRTVFAIYLQGAVYEFDTNQKFKTFPFETFDIDQLHAEHVEAKRKHREARLAKHTAANTKPDEHLRPTFEDLEACCEKYGLCCCVVWKLHAGSLAVDREESCKGTAVEFVEKSETFKLRIGQGVVGRVWASKAIEHHSNVQSLTQIVYPRLDVAKRHNIRTTFAIFLHDRVYEFNTPKELARPPFETLEVTPLAMRKAHPLNSPR